MKIKGVNLGNWLVLEKWMSPALFDGTEAEDEFGLVRQLPREVYEARIRLHRSEYISERDFAFIRSIGLNAVRLPIPYYLFGDKPPYMGCLKEIDAAMDWAEKHELKVLLDMHTVPWGQNGFDNSGICGVCKWSQKPEEVEYVLQNLEKLAKRYGDREALFGIEIVNEPITEKTWNAYGGSKHFRYKPEDPLMAEGSAPNTLSFLENLYKDAYRRLRPLLRDDKYIVFHDGFCLMEWEGIFPREKYKHVMLDTHQYLMAAEMKGCKISLQGYRDYITKEYHAKIRKIQEKTDVFCGEWSLFNSLAVGMNTCGGRTVFDGMDYAKAGIPTPEEKCEIYRTVGKAQQEAWEAGCGSFYWNYKLLLDTLNNPEWQGWDCWDLGKSIALGWINIQE